jgi:hypothetical protein
MTNEFSHGFHGQVFPIDGKPKIFYPNADLVKRFTSTKEKDALKEYYSLKIAHLLYPDNFINPVGATSLERPGKLRAFSHGIFGKSSRYSHSVYTQQAATPLEHATFSSHFTYDETQRFKVQECTCSVCIGHELFHNQFDLRGRATEFAYQLEGVGIYIPYKDQSDYCLDRNGNLVFYEVNSIYPGFQFWGLPSIQAPEEVKARVENLTHRYLLLFQ